jgi:hypothetical protein
MFQEPFRQYSEEAWIAEMYPNWKDASVVDYSWAGLLFPQPQTGTVVSQSVLM